MCIQSLRKSLNPFKLITKCTTIITHCDPFWLLIYKEVRFDSGTAPPVLVAIFSSFLLLMKLWWGITEVYPAPNSQDIALNAQIVITFSEVVKFRADTDKIVSIRHKTTAQDFGQVPFELLTEMNSFLLLIPIKSRMYQEYGSLTLPRTL